MFTTNHPSKNPCQGFDIIELPLVILGLLAAAGILSGAYIWYRNGSLTVVALVAFALALPFLALLAALFVSDWQQPKHGK